MIGVQYDDPYIVHEVFQLLKIPWEWYTPSSTYDVIISKNNQLPNHHNVIDLTDHDILKTIADILNNGLPPTRTPVCDEYLDELRQQIKRFSPLVEIPPMPWGYPYTLALTHDVDIASVRERSLPSVLYATYNCLCQRKFIEGVTFVLAKIGLANDPWNLFETWMALEDQHQVKSTFYVLPRSGYAGVKSPNIRAGYYAIADIPVMQLVAGGWEVGVHGIDNWTDESNAVDERQSLPDEVGITTGTRVHWLHFNADTWQILDRAGYEYDSTFGYNEDVGFRAGTLQVYQPRGVERLLELPLHIQDVSLFGKQCWLTTENRTTLTECLHLNKDEARRTCHEILDQAMHYGGVVTLLWHSDCLTPPRDWGDVYTDIICRAKADNAWFARAIDIVNWFRMRREVQIGSTTTDTQITITITGIDLNRTFPPLRVRVHIDPDRVQYIDAPYVCGDGFVDIKCDREQITVVMV